MSGVHYTVAECEKRIREIDEKIKYYEDLPQVMKDGPVSANQITKIKDLQGERERWEARLNEARRRAKKRNSLQGPDIEIV